jgi:hypothetical protein
MATGLPSRGHRSGGLITKPGLNVRTRFESGQRPHHARWKCHRRGPMSYESEIVIMNVTNRSRIPCPDHKPSLLGNGRRCTREAISMSSGDTYFQPGAGLA